MATGVLTDTSPTIHGSSNSSVRPQNTPDARLTLDETVDRILTRAKSSLEESEIRNAIETLERLLQPHLQISLRTRRRCFRGLMKICGEYGILPNSYIIPESKIEKLGESPISFGGFSSVWPGMYEEDKSVAIKVLRYRKSDDAQKIKKNFCREVIIWKRLSHPNILELIGATMGDGGSYAMVAPWMENGNIVEFLEENPGADPLKLLEDATRGLQYLHRMELAHGDLKGANILVSDDGRACLADVGLTRIAGDLNSPAATPATALTASDDAHTTRWSPPELLDPERFGFERGGPTKMSDVYSMAMTIYEVLTGKAPFYELKDLTAMLSILQGVRPMAPIFAMTRGYTKELWQMTTSCWKENPSERPTVDDILSALGATEQWESRRGGIAALSPGDDRRQTFLMEKSDSPIIPEHEDEPVPIVTSPSLGFPQPPVIKAPVPAQATLSRAHPHPLRFRTFDHEE